MQSEIMKEMLVWNVFQLRVYGECQRKYKWLNKRAEMYGSEWENGETSTILTRLRAEQC